MDSLFEALLQSSLDTSNARKDFEAFKSSIEKDVIKIKADIDTKYLESQINNVKAPNPLKIDVDKLYIQGQIQNALSGIKFQLNPNSYQSSAKQAGQNIGQLISDTAQKSIKKVSSTGINKYFKVSQSDSNSFKNEMDKLVAQWTNSKGKLADVKITTRTSFDNDEGKNIERLDRAVVTYTNDLNEVIKKTIAWRQIGITQNSKGEDVPLRGFVEIASQYSKSLDEVNNKTDNFVSKQKQTVSNLKNTLNQISSNALDQNSSKAIKTDSRRNAITNQVDEVNRAISALENANSTTFTDAKIKVDEEISSLKILIKEMQNAESTATALRAKPIDVVKDETAQKVKGLEADIKKAGVTSQELDKYITDMNTSLGNPKIDASGINDVLNMYAKAKAELSTLKKEASANDSVEKAKIKANGLVSEINKTVTDNSGLSNWETTINGAKTSVSTLIDELSKVKTAGDMSVVTEKWKTFSNAAKQAGVIANDVANDVKKISDAIETKTYDSKISSIKSKLGSYNNGTKEYDTVASSLKEVSNAYDELKLAKDAYDADNSVKNYETLVSANEKLAISIKRTENEMKLLSDAQDKALSSSTIASTKKSFVSYFENNSKAAKAYKEDVAQLEKQLESMSTVADKAKFDTDFKNLQAKAIAEGKTGKSALEDLGRAMKQIGQFAGIYNVIQNLAFQVPQKMYEAVKDVDTAMTNLYKVTDETSAAYDKFLGNVGNKAQELGRSMSSLITQTSEWAKLGYSMADSAKLAEISSIYANVGEVDDATAVSDLVTTMKAFNIEASDSMTIIDQLNKLGNEFATSSADLGEGLSKSASALKTAGTDLNHTLALLTGGAEITQSAGEFGNFLKVASMRIRGMKGELEELGEEVDESVDSISKVQTQILNLTHGRVNIFDSTGEFRDYYKIMEEISAIHDQLSSTEQASLDEILFGKQRANQGAALIQAFQSGQIQKALEATQNAEGSAMEEQTKWLDSIEAKIEKFQAAFQKMSNTAINSDFIKNIIDAGTEAINVLDLLIDKISIFGTIGIGVGITALFKNFGSSNEFAPYGCESIAA